jgi:oxepin-CoA hydrolase/3-oxo-5,6-dehydrosuberyl-CoA semialdehyde dehydrogenase
MQTLESYVQGRWHAGAGQAATLVNPASEEPLARCSSHGVDFRGVLAHARETGSPALRALGFRERGERLAALSAAIHEQREELIDLAVANGGNTRGDAKFDIDGATGTLAAYAALARSLPDAPFLLDGAGVQLGRTARFWGQHVRVPRRGAAVHVNAFNFPAWGMMEKAACALLAGVPVVEKPGTPTALVAWRLAQITVRSGLLPEGSYQFIAGSLGDLLDHLGAQDNLAFTGSSATGAKLKGHPGLVRGNVRVNIEADSLNAAVLAPDVAASAEAYALFLANVVLDMTQKAGQKCTAVRRVLVPAERVNEVRADLAAELARVQVGDPADKATRMGPLATAEQLADVRAGIERLAAEAEIACGGPDPIRERGYFVAPTLLVASRADLAAVHADEVFGPVATVLPYSGDAAEAAAIVRLGGGGLVASVYTNDAGWAARCVAEMGAWHGRIWIGSDKMAEQSLAPGMVLPALVHGGPGRAGGGEELGALRGLEFYTQRLALQGFKGLIEGAFGGGGG